MKNLNTGHSYMRSKGFTLIELLVVVLIIGILSSIALPQYQRAVEKARATEAMMMASSFIKGADMYILSGPTDWKYGTQLLSSLDIDLNIPSKYYYQAQCGYTGYCYFHIHTTTNPIWGFTVYKNNAGSPWKRRCDWKNSVGKAVCEGLRGIGWTPQEASLF